MIHRSNNLASSVPPQALGPNFSYGVVELTVQQLTHHLDHAFDGAPVLSGDLPDPSGLRPDLRQHCAIQALTTLVSQVPGSGHYGCLKEPCTLLPLGVELMKLVLSDLVGETPAEDLQKTC